MVNRAQAIDAGGDREPERGRAVNDDVPVAVPQCKVKTRSTPSTKDQSVQSPCIWARYFLATFKQQTNP